MNTLVKGQKVLVSVEEALEDVVVVSLKRGSKTLRGVLLDTSKRLAGRECNVIRRSLSLDMTFLPQWGASVLRNVRRASAHVLSVRWGGRGS